VLGGCRGETPPALSESQDEAGAAETGHAQEVAPEAAEPAADARDADNTAALPPQPDVAAVDEAPRAPTDVPIHTVTPVKPEEAAEEEAPGRAAIALTPATLADITQGMPIDAVRGVIGSSGHVITQGDVDSAIMRWADEDGNLLVAKFEDGRLLRKSIIFPDGAAPEGDDAARAIERADYEGISPGMTVEEVSESLGVPPRQVTSDRAEVIIFSWRDAAGSSFVARFEDGKLVQKSGFFVAPLKDEQGDVAGDDTEGEVAWEGEPVEEEEAPIRQDNRRLVYDPPPQQPAAPEQAVPQQPQVTSVAPPSQVRVVGGRREVNNDVPENQRGSYQPRAKLPDFTWGLRRGAYEMRIENTTDTRVQAGLRAGQYGKDISIPPNSTRSVDVDRANYQLFYIFDDAPHTLHRGASVDLSGDYSNDVRITLFNQSYDITPIDYAAEFYRGNEKR
jgi:hypothetical protein